MNHPQVNLAHYFVFIVLISIFQIESFSFQSKTI